MGVIVGTSGRINGFSTVRSFTLNDIVTEAEGRASNTGGGPVVDGGNTDWTVELEYYGKIPPAFPGDAVSFVGHTGAGSYSGAGICGAITLNAPIESGGYLGGTMTIGGNGALTRGSTAASDSSLPEMYTASACLAKWAGSTLAGVKSWSLNLARELQTYVESGVTKRLAGNWNYSASIELNEGTPATLIVPGAKEILLLYVDATTYFDIRYMHCNPNRTNVPSEAGGIVNNAYQFKWSSFKRITGTQTRGTIIKPDTTAWWS